MSFCGDFNRLGNIGLNKKSIHPSADGWILFLFTEQCDLLFPFCIHNKEINQEAY